RAVTNQVSSLVDSTVTSRASFQPSWPLDESCFRFCRIVQIATTNYSSRYYQLTYSTYWSKTFVVVHIDNPESATGSTSNVPSIVSLRTWIDGTDTAAFAGPISVDKVQPTTPSVN